MTDSGASPRATAAAGRPIIVLLGVAGAGKGTQAAILAAELELMHLATGDLFRRALRDGTPLGEQARTFMERGDLVPDDITTRLVVEALAGPAAARGAILDGFPRTTAQSEALDEQLTAWGEAVGRVILIEVPVEVLIARLSGRLICPTCGTPYHVTGDPPRVAGRCDRDGTELVQRDDDRPEVVRARLEKQIPPLEEVIAYYQRMGGVVRVDGLQPIHTVTAALRAALRGIVDRG